VDLNLGTHTHDRDIAGRIDSVVYRNVLCFPSQALAMAHLGDATPRLDPNTSSTPCFLLFDRKHVHRFLKELTNGSSLYAERYETSVDASLFLGESYTGVRAQRYKPALVDAPVRTTLFHRWLLQAIPETFIEHLNDIVLDCRETNLRTSGSFLSNNAHIHRVKHALCARSLQTRTRYLFISTPLPRSGKAFTISSGLRACIQTLQADQSKKRQQAKSPKNIDLVQEEHINFVDLVTEELPTIPQVVVIDLTIDPF
jgi:hypothetical protein